MDRLTELLAQVLPAEPEKAVKGPELVLLLRKAGLLETEWNDASLRSRFSQLVGDTNSVIAKRPSQHGYYKRSQTDNEQAAGAKPKDEKVPSSGRESQAEEKFRSVYMAWARSENEYPVHIEHTEGKSQRAGLNVWKFPDVVSVAWDVLQIDEGNREVHPLDSDVLNVRRSLGEQPFKLSSTELKVEVSASTLREIFFQCVSNSRWAHKSRLAIAADLEDEILVKELQRLGASYGVSVLTFALSREDIQKLPSASQITDLNGVEKVLGRDLKVTTISAPADRDIVDWEHIKDMQLQHEEFRRMFRWISKCINDARAYPYNTWKKNMA